MQELRFGVIGVGYMGRLEARMAQTTPGCSLIGVWNRTAGSGAEVAEELGCEHYPTLEAMLADPAINAVIVATANHAHLEPVLAAAHAGKHIFLEKPMALNVADCRQMIEAVQAAGMTLMLGHPQRFIDGVRLARKALFAGEIGQPVALRVERYFWVDKRGPTPTWKMQRELSGGHLFHHLHELCTSRYLLGEYETVYGQMANLAHQADGPEAEDDVVQVAARFKSGVLGTFEFGSAYHRRQHYLRVHGTEGTIIINFQGGSLAISGRSGEIMRPVYDDPDEQRSSDDTYALMNRGRVHGAPKEQVPLFLRQLVRRELEAMVAKVNGTFDDPGNEDLFGGEAGLRAVEAAQAAHVSNDHLQMVKLPLP